jgi:hypothetical protein
LRFLKKLSQAVLLILDLAKAQSSFLLRLLGLALCFLQQPVGVLHLIFRLP